MSRVLNKRHWPYKVAVHPAELAEGNPLGWCAEMFPGKDRWCYAMSGHIHFRDEADALLCQLKWS